MSRRLPGETSGEKLTQASVKAADCITTRHDILGDEDTDKGLPFSVVKSGYVGLCETAAGTVNKVITIQNFPDFELVNGIEVAVYFAHKNTASAPTFNVNNTGNIIAGLENQASGVTIGSGCWGDGVWLTLKYQKITYNDTVIERWIIKGHNIAQQDSSSTSGYTIYADGTTVYKPFFYKKGKEVTYSEIESHFGLNRTHKGYKVECTCFNQGATTYASGVLIESTWNNYHNQYMSISASSSKLTASTSISGQEGNVCWTIYPIEVVSM